MIDIVRAGVRARTSLKQSRPPMTPTSDLTGLLSAPWLLYVLAGSVLGLAALVVALVVHYRRRLQQARDFAAQQTALGRHLSAWHPDHQPTAELAALRQKHRELEQTHAVLLARHKTLIGELERLQQHGDGLATAPPPAPTPARPHR